MPLFTLDARVWISAFATGEPEHEASRSLVDALLASFTPLIEPTLFPVEVAGAISRRRDPDLAKEVAEAVLGLPSIRWVPLDDDLAKQALALAAEHRLRGADAAYAAVARAHGCTLVSLDSEHLTRLASVVHTVAPGNALVLIAAS